MARLDDCRAQIAEALQQLEGVQGAYQHAKGQLATLESQLEAGTVTTVKLPGLGLSIVFENGVQAPLAMPSTPAAVQEMLEDACAFLGQEIIRLWGVIHTASTSAAEHCRAAAAAVDAPPAGS